MNEQNDERFDERPVAQPAGAPATAPQGPSSALIAVIGLLAVAVIVSLVYGFSERKRAQNLAAQQQQMSSELRQGLDTLAALRAQVNAMNVPAASQPAISQPVASQNAAVAGIAATSTTHVRRKQRTVADPHWAKVENELAAQRKQLQSTQQDLQTTRQQLSDNLQSTRDDLNGSIAKTHDELVALEKKGERDYHEFDLKKSKDLQRVGPVSLALKKASTKHDYYDVTLLVGDSKLDKKHVNLYEPVLIYPEGSRQPLELVVNQISKDRIHGYVSAPKYLAEVTSSAPNTSTAGSSGAPSGSATQDSALPPPHRGAPSDTASSEPRL
jgi:hypothetical protein